MYFSPSAVASPSQRRGALNFLNELHRSTMISSGVSTLKTSKTHIGIFIDTADEDDAKITLLTLPDDVPYLRKIHRTLEAA